MTARQRTLTLLLPLGLVAGNATAQHVITTFDRAPGAADLLPGDRWVQGTWKVVDTGQDRTYRSEGMTVPDGQDASYDGHQFSYTVSTDGLTVYDNNTRLTWTRDYMADPSHTHEPYRFWYSEAEDYVDELNAEAYGGITTWRLPTIKELYSLMDFRGSSDTGTSYIVERLKGEDIFVFRWGDDDGDGEDDPGEEWRVIDSQYWTSTAYVGLTFDDNPTVFGVNFADGRIKGYPTDRGGDGVPMRVERAFLRPVSGPIYGVNRFVDNGDGTITDEATGLMWMQGEGGYADWEEALDFAENLDYAGHSDWRLPNAKELHSIIDYTRAPDASDPAVRGPALDPVFQVSEVLDTVLGRSRYPWYWTSTTHLEKLPPPWDHGAVYVTVGLAYGWWCEEDKWVDVHGAGAQRSDPKYGIPDDFPPGCAADCPTLPTDPDGPCGTFGPQKDLISIHNLVRCVRDVD